ncbi:MAG TPA: MrtC family glutamic-type intramembrane protease [Polyangiaceae bacterium LLY-WYZ-14_1]|nr:MrtC family glutamic-type intramembrane protease [Polyangiaceae bacterium LLY-WYZ-14_1]
MSVARAQEPGPRRGPLAEALLAWLAVSLAAAAVVGVVPASAGGWQALAVGMLFLVAAMRLAGRHPEGLAGHGIDLGGVLEEPAPSPSVDGEPGTGAEEGGGALGRLLRGAMDLVRAVLRATPAGLRETGVALLVAALLFPPYGWLYGLVEAPAGRFDLRLPPALPDLAVSQLLVVALPEEAFFRGYLQTRLERAFPPRVRLFGRTWSPGALLIQALLFGVVHLAVDRQLGRLATAVPGLLFGVLRSWRGGIGAAVVLHAASNLCAEVLARSWRP